LGMEGGGWAREPLSCARQSRGAARQHSSTVRVMRMQNGITNAVPGAWCLAGRLCARNCGGFLSFFFWLVVWFQIRTGIKGHAGWGSDGYGRQHSTTTLPPLAPCLLSLSTAPPAWLAWLAAAAAAANASCAAPMAIVQTQGGSDSNNNNSKWNREGWMEWRDCPASVGVPPCKSLLLPPSLHSTSSTPPLPPRALPPRRRMLPHWEASPVVGLVWGAGETGSLGPASGTCMKMETGRQDEPVLR